MMKYFNKIVDMIYPPRCPVCDKMLDPLEGRIHKQCAKQLQKIEGVVCLHCGRPVFSDLVEYCYDCAKKSDEKNRQISFLFYRNNGILEFE